MHLLPALFRFKFVLWFVYIFFTDIITHIVAFYVIIFAFDGNVIFTFC